MKTNVLLSLFIFFILAGCQSDITVEKAEVAGTVINAKAKLQPTSSTVDYGAILSSTTKTLATIQVKNNGGVLADEVTASISGTAFTFTGGSFPGTNGTCDPDEIAEDETCVMEVSFDPSGSNTTFSETITLEYKSDGESGTTDYTVTITGEGAAATTLTSSEAGTYDFGDLPTSGGAGATATRIITITNSGRLNATGVNFSGLAGSVSVVSDADTTCDLGGSGTIQGAAFSATNSCNVKIQFAPTTVESMTDTLIVGYNDGSGGASLNQALEGEGVSAASLTINGGSTIDFGTVSQNSTNNFQSVTVLNTGNTAFGSFSSIGVLSSPFQYKGGGSFPGTGGTCDMAVGLAKSGDAGDSCTIELEYLPTGANTHNEDLEITYNNGVSSVLDSESVVGIATGPGNLNISGNNLGTKVIGESYDIDITLSNTGQTDSEFVTTPDLSGAPSQISYKTGSFPGGVGATHCTGTEITAGDSCIVTITYAPDGAGPYSEDFNFTYNNGSSIEPSNSTITGDASTKAVLVFTVADNPFDFTPSGHIPVNTQATKTINIQNTGGSDASITSYLFGTGVNFEYTNSNSFPGTNGNCSATTIAGGTTCAVEIAFDPDNNTGDDLSDTFSVVYNDGTGPAAPLTANLSGDSDVVASLSFSSTSNSYGTYAINTSETDNTYSLTLTNDSTNIEATSLTPVFTSTGGSSGTHYSINDGSSTCDNPNPLTGGQSCVYVIEFDPTATGNPLADTLTLSWNDGVSSQNQPISLTGIGQNPAVLNITADTATDYGTVAEDSDETDNVGAGRYNKLTFTITNNGVSPAVSATSIGAGSLPTSYRYSGGTFPGTPDSDGCVDGGSLAEGEDCKIEVEFNPTSVNTFAGNIVVNYDDESSTTSGQDTTVLAITGEAAAKVALTVAADVGSSTSFGTFATGSNRPESERKQTFVITNSSSDLIAKSFSVSLTGADAGEFSIDTVDVNTTCDDITELAASGTCKVVVLYSPVTAAVHSASVTAAFDDGTGSGSNNDTEPLAITGTAATPANIVINPNGSDVAQAIGFGSVARASVNELTINVKNIGGSNAIDVAGAAPALGDFRYKGTGDIASAGVYPGTGGTCSTQIDAGDTCTVVLEYISTDPNETDSSTYELTYDNGDDDSDVSSSVAISGTTVDPAFLTLTVNNSTTYGTRAQRTNIAQDYTFTLTNTGGVDATSVTASLTDVSGETNWTISNQNPAGCATSGTVDASGGANDTCILTVRFAPNATATVGAVADALEVTWLDGQETNAAGAEDQTSDLDGDGNTQTEKLAQAITGTAQTAASIVVDGGSAATSPHGFSSVAINSVNEITITLTNSGGVEATGLASTPVAPIRYKDDGALANAGTYPGTGGTCGTELAAGDTCTVVIEYVPTGTHTLSSTENLLVTYNNEDDGDGDTGATDEFEFTFTGSAIPQANLEMSIAGGVDYGDKASGTSSPVVRTVTISHPGASATVPATSLDIALSDETHYTITDTGSCDGLGSLAYGATCQFTVTFLPNTVADNLTSVLSLTWVDGQSSDASNEDTTDADSLGNTERHELNLTGNGKNPAILGVTDNCDGASSPSPYDYLDNVVGSTDNGDLDGNGNFTGSNGNFCTFTLTNSGDVTASSIDIAAFSNTDFKIQGGSWPGSPAADACTDTLAASDSCNFVVKYEPTAVEADTDSLVIDYDNDTGMTSTTAFTLNGNGKLKADLDITVASGTDFGHVFAGMRTGSGWSKADKTITVTNNGSVPAKISATPTSPDAEFVIDNTDCTTGVEISASGGSCTIDISFRPTTAEAGAKSAQFIVTYDNFHDTPEAPMPNTSLTGTSKWKQRQQIKIDLSGSIAADITNFPLAIKMVDANLHDTEVTRTHVTFVDSDGTQIAHEFETFNVTGDSLVWVNIPTVLKTFPGGDTDQSIYMYYEDLAFTSTQESTDGEVWQSDYDAVYHMTDNNDYSGNDRHLTPYGTTPKVSDGNNILGTHVELPFSTLGSLDPDKLIYENGADVFQNGDTAFTISFWAKADNAAAGANHQGFTMCIDPIDPGINVNEDRFDMSVSYSNGENTTNALVQTEDILVGITTDGVPASSSSTTAIGSYTPDEDWKHIAVTWSAGNVVKVYQDGVSIETAGGTAGGAISDCAKLIIGQGADNSSTEDAGQQNNFVGKIDEFRYSNVEKSADWIKAMFDSEKLTPTAVQSIEAPVSYP